jgi:hypothetical protein
MTVSLTSPGRFIVQTSRATPSSMRTAPARGWCCCSVPSIQGRDVLFAFPRKGHPPALAGNPRGRPCCNLIPTGGRGRHVRSGLCFPPVLLFTLDVHRHASICFLPRSREGPIFGCINTSLSPRSHSSIHLRWRLPSPESYYSFMLFPWTPASVSCSLCVCTSRS